MFEKHFTDLNSDNIESKTGFLSTPELFWGRIRLCLFKGLNLTPAASPGAPAAGRECSRDFQEMGFVQDLSPCLAAVLPVMLIMMLMLNLN